MEKYYLSEYKEYLIENQRSLRTTEDYIDNVILFIEQFNSKNRIEFEPNIISQNDIIEYLKNCIHHRKLSISSINLRLQSLKSYYRFLTPLYIQDNPFEGIKKLKEENKPKSKAFSNKGYYQLSELINNSGKALHIAIWEVLTTTSLNISKMCDLTMNNLTITEDDDGGSIKGKIIVSEKGTYNEIPLVNSCCVAIKNWIKFRETMNTDSQYLFLSIRKEKFSRSGIYRIIKKY
jgi:integrase/recombinase XerC